MTKEKLQELIQLRNDIDALEKIVSMDEKEIKSISVNYNYCKATSDTVGYNIPKSLFPDIRAVLISKYNILKEKFNSL